MFGFLKKKEIEITNKLEFEETLMKLVGLLQDNAFISQADAVRQVLDALTKDYNQKFIKTVNSVEIWGGAGSVWEVSGFQTENDEKEFMKQIIRLTNLMKEVGIKNGRALSTANIFKKALEEKNNITGFA